MGDALYGASGVYPGRSVVATKMMLKAAMAPSDHDAWGWEDSDTDDESSPEERHRAAARRYMEESTGSAGLLTNSDNGSSHSEF